MYLLLIIRDRPLLFPFPSASPGRVEKVVHGRSRSPRVRRSLVLLTCPGVPLALLITHLFAPKGISRTFLRIS